MKRFSIWAHLMACSCSFCLLSCHSGETEKPAAVDIPDTVVHVVRTTDLNIYEPRFSRIDLVCGTMPSKSDTSIILMAEAAFTAELEEDFSHSNICGIHVSGGNLYKGAFTDGGFVYYNGHWKFLYITGKSEFNQAARQGGMGFSQKMIIYQGVKLPLWRHNSNFYRALCEKDGRLMIVDSRQCVRYADFVKALAAYGVENALYLDMGSGWNYSWYRETSNGGAKEIFQYPTAYATNWITFYR